MLDCTLLTLANERGARTRAPAVTLGLIWFAIAPTRDLRCGASAPTAKKRVATATPNCPVFLSRAMIDQVMCQVMPDRRCLGDRNQALGAP